MGERIFVAHWEGPYAWNEYTRHVKAEHVLYALYGAHPLYGRNVLLYLGKAERGAGKRLPDHEWVADEYDPVEVRLASVGEFLSWDDWNKKERYPRAPANVVRAVEAMLIVANQPVYNSRGKGSTGLARSLRIFNTGHLGHLLPEASYLYHAPDWWSDV